MQGENKGIEEQVQQIVDKLRRSGAGRESDESEIPADFPYFAVLDAVLGKRASVTPVQLLDTAEVSQHDTSTSRPITPSPIAAIPEEPLSPVQISGPSNALDTAEMGQHDSPDLCSRGPSINRPSTPSLTAAIHEEPPSIVQTSGPSSSHEETPGPSGSHSSGTPISKKRRKRPTKLSRAEASAKGIVSDILEGQDKAKKRREELEIRQLELEEKMAAEEREIKCFAEPCLR